MSDSPGATGADAAGGPPADAAGGPPAQVIGVLGAGTMGSGIAQLAARAGARTLLYDPIDEALQAGVQRARDGLEQDAARGRLEPQAARAAQERLEAVAELSALRDCELVIEAAPESLELKHQLYERLSEVVGEDCVLATNTSSLPVTAIAAGASRPERVVGMHFFNPAPRMRLLEIVAGEDSSPAALALARATGTAMGKTVIDATDGPGFLVNRCNRPFGLEALRLLAERIADIPTIDRICRLGGGFRMGPFELMDLVGVDLGFEVSKSFYEQSFGEPRWRPSPITARYVAAGRHGRKSGRGYYDYRDGPHRPDDPEPPQAGGGDGEVLISGEGLLAGELREAAAAAGWSVTQATADAIGGAVEIALPQARLAQARLVLCEGGALAELDPARSAVGFYALAPLADTRLVELVRGERSEAAAVAGAERFFASLGKHVAWVADAPGLVLGRIACQLVNECAFALGEGVGSAADIDAGMVLGLNHPRGPLAWARQIGQDRVVAVLAALHRHYGEERYRLAPALRRPLPSA